MNTKIKKIKINKKQTRPSVTISRAIILLSLLLIVAPSIKAQTNELDQIEKEFSCEYPCKVIFDITAYYSPKPDQEFYNTGSYSGDIRLNGNGTNGADGTQVYPGMVAAPKIFPFGTKIQIPDIGITTVHDRGGAIVPAGSERGNKHHRLDIWMGEGEEGLKNALRWGRRTVEVTILEPNNNNKDDVTFSNFIGDETNITRIKKYSYEYKYFSKDLSFAVQNEQVKLLQDYLVKFNYLKKKDYSSGLYDQNTLKAVFAFQSDQAILSKEDDFGAGYFGAQSRKTFEKIIEEFENKKLKFLSINLGKEDKGEDVLALQENLWKLNLLKREDISGKYDNETIDAIYNFQIKNNLIVNDNDLGAGYLGPKTRESLRKLILNPKRETINASSANDVSEKNTKFNKKITYFKKELQFGDKSEDTRMLQEHLRKLGYLTIEPSGYYGEITAHAVLKFQQSQGIITNTEDIGAGVVGPKTRDILNKIIASNIEKQKFIAQAKDTKKKERQVALIMEKEKDKKKDLLAAEIKK